MALEKLQIVPEKAGGKLQFDQSHVISALFNPKQFAYSRSVGWKSASAAQRDVPELQFTTAEPASLTIDLLFDTYDAPDLPKKDVRKEYTDKLLHLATVETHGDKHRPPVCRLRWGAPGYFFQGVLEKQDQKFTMFMEDGTPVRATVSCSFKEWRTNYDDLNRENRQSADVAKRWIVKSGDSLSRIAAQEYMDPALWRPIAARNEIDDPLALHPGRVIRIPMLTIGEQTGKRGPGR